MRGLVRQALDRLHPQGAMPKTAILVAQVQQSSDVAQAAHQYSYMAQAHQFCREAACLCHCHCMCFTRSNCSSCSACLLSSLTRLPAPSHAHRPLLADSCGYATTAAVALTVFAGGTDSAAATSVAATTMNQQQLQQQAMLHYPISNMPQEYQQQPDKIAEHFGMWVTHQLFQEEMKPHSMTGLLHVSVQNSVEGDTVH